MAQRISNLQDLEASLRALTPYDVSGRVVRVVGNVIESHMPDCAVGQVCEIETGAGRRPVLAEVVGFQEHRAVLMPLGEMRGLKPGSTVRVLDATPSIPAGDGLLGRVLNAFGEPIDGKGPLSADGEAPLYAAPRNPFQRRRISEPLDVGVRAVNALATVCVGQRMAIMAGSGVGKSTLLGMMARHTEADVNVIGLVGERGRELKDFLERDLGPEGLARSVVVVGTSDLPALIRVRTAFAATAVAEYFRDRGRKVLLMMDSITRFAMAQREVGLAAGEPPTSKGYTPSVFSLLPALLERVGMGEEGGEGSITGLYTVLVEGDDFTEPVADAVRAILDGHIVLSRDLADRGHYPAIDVLGSVSRLMQDVVTPQHRQWASRIVQHLAAYRRAEALINIGAYARGSNPEIDVAMQMQGPINQFLRQDIEERAAFGESLEQLRSLADTRSPVPTTKAQNTGGDLQPRPGA